jgi:hypothetical protein
LASLSARIAGALERRLKGKAPIDGDGYVLRKGQDLLHSLQEGERVLSGNGSGCLDDQAMSAMPAAMTTLSHLRPQLSSAEIDKSEDFSKLYEVLSDVLAKALSPTDIPTEVPKERLALSVDFFKWLGRLLSDDLEREMEPESPTLEQLG